MYVDMACIVMYDNISIARSKRVNEKIVLCYTVQDEDQFPCKSSGLWFLQNFRVIGAMVSEFCFFKKKKKLF